MATLAKIVAKTERSCRPVSQLVKTNLASPIGPQCDVSRDLTGEPLKRVPFWRNLVVIFTRR
jgi:hypothetical protein